MRDNGIIAHCVFGGFRMAREVWERGPDGWECDYDINGLDDTVWPTRAECQAAIDRAEAQCR